MISVLSLDYKLYQQLRDKVNISLNKQFFFISFLLLLGAVFSQPSWAQLIKSAADGTNTTIKQNGNQFNITGGKLSGDRTNLFQSFSQFNLDQNQIANFLSQPNIKNILGRVVGGNASVINGLIKVTGSNANLFLINPAGIVFGTYAHLNVPASFTATTATGIGFGNNTRFNATGLNDYTSLVGNPESFAFNVNQPGSIINAGSLQVGTGQNIFLLGGNVINTGTLTAPSGNLTLAAVPGTSLVKVSQTGHLLNLEIAPQQGNTAVGITPLTLPELLTGHGLNPATGITVDSTGQISLTSSGVAIASGNLNVAGQTGGAVNVLGNNVNLINANINAAGVSGGGQVLIGGDEHGQGTVPNAQSTFVDQNTQINADALASGNGGKVIVWSDNNTVFAGNISAQGGSQGGNGGFVETSGKNLLTVGKTAQVNTSAIKGQIGTWLLDPTDLTVVGDGSGTGTITYGNNSSADSTINNSTIVMNLNGNNVNLTASNSISVNAAINASANGNLTLSAPTTNLNAPITLATGSTLSGTATTVNVGIVGLIQNGVDAAAIGGSVNLAATAYTVTQPVTISKSLTVTGMGTNNTIISGNSTTQVFDISGTNTAVNLDALKVTNGNSSTNGNAGGIQVATGNTVNINNSTISNNQAPYGGGINNNGTLTINNSTILGNQANNSNGGGIFNNSPGILTINSSTISNNNATQDGGGIENYGTLTINNSNISGNISNREGGGILDYSSSSVYISNSVISGNQAVYGGGFYGGSFNNLPGIITINNSNIINNQATQDGGGINNFGTLTINNSNISDNSSMNGGGIQNNTSSTVNINNNSTISGNQINTYAGGGIANYGTLNVNNSNISNNIDTATGAESGGGGIYNLNGTTTINNSTISSNQAEFAGGIYNAAGTVTINNSIISGNQSNTLLGGGISNYDTLYITNNSIISVNQANTEGGGIYNSGTVTIDNSTISGNQANTAGGGIYNYSSGIVTINNSTISSNQANISGGGIYNDSGMVAIDDSTISGNQANALDTQNTSNGGGGILNLSGTVNVNNSNISNNIAAGDGGGIWNDINGLGVNPTVTIYNSNISDNQSYSIGGGGIFNTYGTVDVTNSNISSNITTGEGGGIRNSVGTLSIKNSIISDNQANTVTLHGGGGIESYSSNITIDNSTISNNLTKIGVGDEIYSHADSSLSLMDSSIIGGREGLVLDGSSSSVSLNNTIFSGQVGTYISLINGALLGSTLDATAVQFDGLTGATATTSQLFAIEDKLGNSVNDPTVGFIRIKANNVFVTPSSGSIQRGVDSASSGDIINVETGTYDDSTLNISKPVNLIFDGNGATINGSLTTAANVGLNGILTASSFSFNSAINLINTLTLKTNGNIIFSNTVDGAQNLNLTAGGDINFNGAVGSITPLTGLTISNAANITSGNINTNGPVSLTSSNDITTGNITTNGYDINLLATNQIIAQNLDSSANIGNGGNITIDPLNITVDTINAQGGTAGIGGTIDITTTGLFRATGTFTDRNGTLASISTAGGAGSGDITIFYSTAFPFTVGDATNQGTAGAITSAATNIIAPTLSFESYIQGNISLNALPIIPNFKEQDIQDMNLQLTLYPGKPDILTLDAIKRKRIFTLFLQEDIEAAITLIEDLYSSEYIGYYGNDFVNDRSQDSQETPSLQTVETIKAALRKIAHQTGNKSAIVYMVSQPESLELIVITPEGKTVHKSVKAANRQALLEMVNQFHNKLFIPINKNAYKSSSKKLYELLIKPIEPTLAAEKIDTLLFSVDNGLRSLPFAALYDGHQFLVEKYSLGIIPSVTLMDTRYKSLRNAKVLAMGASKFIDNNSLPGVAVELPNIVQELKQKNFFINDQFTVSNLLAKRQQQPTDIIHLATHGYFNAGTPKNSYIQFWNQEKLRLDQIRQLGLKNPPVELLVLSACHTALGNEEVELGFAGLAVQAGVKSALASLWSASDEGTLALMIEFYQRLRTTSIKAEALRQAQIAMIKGQVTFKDGKLQDRTNDISLPSELKLSGTLDLSHPYYWAAFTMIGSPW